MSETPEGGRTGGAAGERAVRRGQWGPAVRVGQSDVAASGRRGAEATRDLDRAADSLIRDSWNLGSKRNSLRGRACPKPGSATRPRESPDRLVINLAER